MGKIRILVAGDPGSIHTGRFVSLLQEIGYDTRIFQSENYYIQDEHIKNTIIYVNKVTKSPINNNILIASNPFIYRTDNRIIYACATRIISIIMDLLKIGIFSKYTRTDDLICTIKNWRPDIIFSLKMQNDGYTVCDAKIKMGPLFKSKWIHFNWGTDLEFFGKHPRYKTEHLPKIKRVLSNCDYFVADCERDVKQAKIYGLKGVNLGMQLANGGFDLGKISKITKHLISKRKTILIKGRDWNDIGNALQIIKAIEQLHKHLKGYRIKIILATENVNIACHKLKQKYGLDIQILNKLPYNKLLEIFGESRIAISSTFVDGTPSFLAEAMLMGAFPIHSDMASVREWVDSGLNGYLFPIQHSDILIKQIEDALSNNKMLKYAQQLNSVIAQNRMNRSIIKEEWREILENITNN